MPLFRAVATHKMLRDTKSYVPVARTRRVTGYRWNVPLDRGRRQASHRKIEKAPHQVCKSIKRGRTGAGEGKQSERIGREPRASPGREQSLLSFGPFGLVGAMGGSVEFDVDGRWQCRTQHATRHGQNRGGAAPLLEQIVAGERAIVGGVDPRSVSKTINGGTLYWPRRRKGMIPVRCTRHLGGSTEDGHVVPVATVV